MWPLLALLLNSLLIPQALAATVPTVPLPTTIDYREYAATQITAHPFSNEPKGRVAAANDKDITPWFGPAPECTAVGSPPQLEIFLVNKDQCIIEGDAITYKVLVRNLGKQDAYNVKIAVNIPANAEIINSNLPDPYVGTIVPGTTILEFHESPTDDNTGVYQALLGNNGTAEFNFTLKIKDPTQPFTVSAKLIYQSCDGRKDRYNCLKQCIPACILACDKKRDECKKDCVKKRETCGKKAADEQTKCNNKCAEETEECKSNPNNSPTPTPSLSPSPTPTPTPSPTPTPTPTPSPSPTGRPWPRIPWVFGIRSNPNQIAYIPRITRLPTYAPTTAPTATPTPGPLDCDAQSAACSSGCASKYDSAIAACDTAKQQCDTTCDDNWVICKNNCIGKCEKTCDKSIETSTSLTIDGSCVKPDISPTATPPKKPAIICGEGDYGCTPTMPDLGFNFKTAKAWLNNPQLGARFKEAIMSILPGECSVLEDFRNIILPPFHDALNREAKPAADFMQPLYDSGADFNQLVHENELLGITNELTAKKIISAIHAASWTKLGNEIDRVLNKTAPSSLVRNDIDRIINDNIWSVQHNAQPTLAIYYKQMQNGKRAKFDPIAEAAVNNAKQSICRACPDCGSDAGLEDLLKTVKGVYEMKLNDRIEAYKDTQQSFLDFKCVKEDEKPKNWKPVLISALDAFDRGNPTALRQFNNSFVHNWMIVFNRAWQCTYGLHAEMDKDTDNLVKQAWQRSLDKPKAIAAKCEADKTFAAPVESSWCESNGYPEAVIKGAPAPVKIKEVRPPLPISGEGQAPVVRTDGQVCGGRPGDPYWADDCSCHCKDVVSGGSGVATCEGTKNITQHDINITSQAECLLNLPKHKDPFL